MGVLKNGFRMDVSRPRGGTLPALGGPPVFHYVSVAGLQGGVSGWCLKPDNCKMSTAVSELSFSPPGPGKPSPGPALPGSITFRRDIWKVGHLDMWTFGHLVKCSPAMGGNFKGSTPMSTFDFCVS